MGRVIDTKKIIAAFLILAAVTSSAILVFSNFNSDDSEKRQKKETSKPAPNSEIAIKNAFVEEIPQSTSTKFALQGLVFGEVPEELLPPKIASSNLTERFANGITRELIRKNPKGPTKDAIEDGYNLLPPEFERLRDYLDRSLLIQVAKEADWDKEVSETQKSILVVENPSPKDLSNYIKFLNKALSESIKTAPSHLTASADGKILEKIGGEIENVKKIARETPVPSNFLNLHNNLTKILIYQKKATALINTDDPLKSALILKNREGEYYKTLSSLANETLKLNEISLEDNQTREKISLIQKILFIKKAEAQFFPALPLPVMDITQITIQEVSLSQSIWEYVKKVITEIFKDVLLRMIQTQLVSWIAGGPVPGFVTNWKNFLADAVTETTERVITEEAPWLCKDFGPLLTISLTPIPPTQGGGSSAAACTLDTVISNVTDFYNDFKKGGFIALTKSMEPQNNYWGSFLLLTDKIIAETSKEKEDKEKSASAAHGFLSTKKCVKEIDLYQDPISSLLPSPLPIGTFIGKLCVEYEETTPGKIIAQSLIKTTEAPTDRIVNAQDLINLFTAIIDALINRVISEASKGLIGLGQQGPEEPPIYTEDNVPQIPSCPPNATSTEEGEICVPEPPELPEIPTSPSTNP